MTSVANKLTRITVDDFMTGLLCQLALDQHRVIPIDSESFDTAVELAFKRLEQVASHYELDVRFWITRHPFHGDSPVVREAISGAVQRDLVSLDNPEYQHMRLKITKEEATLMLSRVPGGEPLFQDLGEVLLSSLDPGDDVTDREDALTVGDERAIDD